MSTIVSVMERLSRAGKHINAANELAASFAHKDLYRISLKQNRQGRFSVIVDELNSYPRQLSFIIGDAAHNLCAALDNLAFAVVKPKSGFEDKVYFPVTKCRNEFNRVAPRYLPGVTQRVRAAFARLQPYNCVKVPDARYLLMLKAINNWDKHKTLAVCAAQMGGIMIHPVASGPHTFSLTSTKIGVLKQGAVIATIQIHNSTGIPSDGHVNMHPEIPITPVFDKSMSPVFRKQFVINTLRKSLWFIERTVVPNLSEFI